MLSQGKVSLFPSILPQDSFAENPQFPNQSLDFSYFPGGFNPHVRLCLTKNDYTLAIWSIYGSGHLKHVLICNSVAILYSQNYSLSTHFPISRHNKYWFSHPNLISRDLLHTKCQPVQQICLHYVVSEEMQSLEQWTDLTVSSIRQRI